MKRIAILLLLSFYELHANPVIHIDIGRNHCEIKVEQESGRQTEHFYLNQTADITNFLREAIPTQRVVLFCHSLYGGTWPYYPFCMSTIENDLLSAKEVTVIGVKWGALNPFYHSNMRIAKERGAWVGHILNRLGPDYQLQFIGHSMGNRVLEGVMGALQKEDVSITDVIMISPDIEAQYIQANEERILELTDDLLITYNRWDWALNLSRILNFKNRLGLKPADHDEDHYLSTSTYFFWMGHNQWLMNRRLKNEIKRELEFP